MQSNSWHSYPSIFKEALFKYAWPHIKRACTRGFPEFYKERLMRQQFEVRVGPVVGEVGRILAEEAAAGGADNAAADRTDPC